MERPRVSLCIWSMKPAWTAERFRKCASALRTAIDVRLRSIVALALFLPFAMCAPLAGQERNAHISVAPKVTSEDLLVQPSGENWPRYNGDYSGRRYSRLDQINASNAAKLRAAWVFHPGNSENLEVTPIVVRGIMYVTSANDTFALDARTGRAVWHYHRPISAGLLDDAAAHKNRGVAVLGNSVFVETDDAHLLSLDARSGGLLWDVQYADKTKHYGATSAPLVVKNLVVVGTSGGDSGVRGFLAAFDAATGKRKWQLWTIP